MPFRVYLSNIRTQWPIARQEEVLDAAIPEWRQESIYRDQLSRAAIKRQDRLKQRDEFLLRPSSRSTGGDRVYVASLGVIAWTPTDLIAVLMRLAARLETLYAVAEELIVDPTKDDLDALKATFTLAARRFAGAGISGGESSGRRRSEAAQAKIERIKPYWPLPSEEYPTSMLCKREGVSRPTVIQYLGSRKAAQLRHQAAQKIAASNRRRKQRGPE